MKKINVLFVSHSAGLYGAERSLVTLIDGFLRDDRYAVMALLPSDGPLKTLLEERRVPVEVQRFSRWIHQRNPFAPFYHAAINGWALATVSRRVREFCPDIIYSNSLTNPFGALLAKKWKIRHVWHAREFIEEDLAATFDAAPGKVRRLLARSTRILCNSEAVRRKWENFLPNQGALFETVYNGIEDLPLGGNRESADCLRLCQIASIHPGKGQLDAVGALPFLICSGIDSRLELVGSIEDKRYANEIRRRIDLENLAGRVLFTDFIKDSREVYRRADLSLICSRSEAFGRTALEALASGVFTIAANAGGLPEIIEDEKTGLFYEPGDPSALARAIERYLANRSVYDRELGLRKKAVLDRFGTETYVRKIKEIFQLTLHI